jgi:hypothetical protein
MSMKLEYHKRLNLLFIFFTVPLMKVADSLEHKRKKSLEPVYYMIEGFEVILTLRKSGQHVVLTGNVYARSASLPSASSYHGTYVRVTVAQI